MDTANKILMLSGDGTGGGGQDIRLALNDMEIDAGDSMTNQGNAQNSTVDRSTLTIGLWNWIAARSGSRLLVPIDGNQGVSGERLDQISVRMPAIIARQPKLIGLLGGRNDLDQGASGSTMVSRAASIVAQVPDATKMHIITALDGFGLSAFTTQQQIDRGILNTYLKGLAVAQPNRIVVTDSDACGVVEADMAADGKHPAWGAAYKIGSQGALDRAKFLPIGNVIDTGYPSFILNPTFTGGVTTAPNWTSTVVVGGAVATLSKYTNDRQRAQVVGALGAGASRRIDLSFSHDIPAIPAPPAGAVLQGIIDFELLSDVTATVNIGFFYSLVTSGAVVLGAGQAMVTAFADPEHPLKAGRYVHRSPPVQMGAGVPFRLTGTARIGFPNAGGNANADWVINRADVIQVG